MKTNLFIYEVIRWGGGGEDDTVFLVSASTVDEAAELVDVQLSNMAQESVKPFAQAVCEIAPDPRSGEPTIILGPCFQNAYDYGWKKWERAEERGGWKICGSQ
jgi:hypothetical protein